MLASASGHSTPSGRAVTAAAAPTTAAPARAGIQTGDDATAAVAAVAVATVAAVAAVPAVATEAVVEAAVNVAVAPAIPVSPNPGPDTPTPRQNVKGSLAVKDLWIITSIMQGHENLSFFQVRSP